MRTDDADVAKELYRKQSQCRASFWWLKEFGGRGVLAESSQNAKPPRYIVGLC